MLSMTSNLDANRGASFERRSVLSLGGFSQFLYQALFLKRPSDLLPASRISRKTGAYPPSSEAVLS